MLCSNIMGAPALARARGGVQGSARYAGPPLLGGRRVYIYLSIYLPLSLSIHIYIYIYIHIMYMYMYVCMYTYIYIYIILKYICIYCCIMSCYIISYEINQAAPNARLREHATSAPAELGGGICNVSRNRTRTQVLPQSRSCAFTEVARLVPSGGSDRLTSASARAGESSRPRAGEAREFSASLKRGGGYC